MMKKKIIAYKLILFLVLLLVPGIVFATTFFMSPYEGAVINNNRPLIRFSYPKNSIILNSIKIFVNKINITESSIKTSTCLVSMPPFVLPNGINRVKVIFKDIKGKSKEIKWTFKIFEKNSIISVSHDVKDELIINQVLKVTLKGKTKCKASFDIGNLYKDIPLNEVSPGLYEGRYKVKKGDYAENTKITAHLISQDGSVSKKVDPIPIDIDTRFFKAKITSPNNLEKVGRHIKIKGRTWPNLTVYISSKLGISDGIQSPLGTPATRQVTSDSKGYFSYEYYFPITMKGLRATITAHAVDAKGNKSIPDQVVVYVEGKEKNKKN